ncbi:FAD-binding oxidoreductase [Nakamurella deserti]|uniref:FAD-binding oxidoreductase n=1 Tax=Nakamurella deserti TaxID=2164074 RepID=UPI00197B74AE|nr:FAD-binding oxidoreductase [Nakamurella deserti]
MIVFAQDSLDVVNALTWARQHHMAVRIRSGRHSLEGWSSLDDGLVVDVSELKSTVVDASARTATIGAGLTQMEVVEELGRFGCAVPTGTEGTVGVVGATLGGGFGLLTRSFGMASDNLLAAEVVVAPADGGAAVVQIGEGDDSGLLWALRGAGNGNFGVVTSLTYRIHPLPEAVFVTATWTGLDELESVFAAWQHLAPHAADGLTSQLEIRRDEMVLFAVLTSGDRSDAEHHLAPVLAIGHPRVSSRRSAWTDIYRDLQIPSDDEPANWKFRSQFVSRPFPPEAVRIIGSFMGRAPTSHCNYFTNAFGGAVRDSEPNGGSAFAHRDALFYAEPGAGWGDRAGVPAADDALTPVCLRWLEEFGTALQPFVDGGYVNVPNPGMSDWPTAYWGPHVDRLIAIKARVDPDGVFRYEQSVPTR